MAFITLEGKRRLQHGCGQVYGLVKGPPEPTWSFHKLNNSWHSRSTAWGGKCKNPVSHPVFRGKARMRWAGLPCDWLILTPELASNSRTLQNMTKFHGCNCPNSGPVGLLGGSWVFYIELFIIRFHMEWENQSAQKRLSDDLSSESFVELSTLPSSFLFSRMSFQS